MDWIKYISGIDLQLLIPPLAFIGGVVIQCLSLLREKPPKWGIVTFLGIFFYMIIMMFYAISRSLGSLPKDKMAEPVISLIMSLGMVFACLFIIVFLKSVVKVINESVIVSNTVSYWFILFESWTYFGMVTTAFLVLAGIIFGIVSFRLVSDRERIRNIYKYYLYGWYLFVNGIFAVSYFHCIPEGFHMLPTLVNKGQVPPFTMMLTGMITVHIFFNFGILYYSFIYSLLSSDTRKGLVEYSGRIFGDKQVSAAAVKNMVIVQAVSFLVVEVLLSYFFCQFVALWMLMTPVIVILFNLTKTKINQ